MARRTTSESTESFERGDGEAVSAPAPRRRRRVTAAAAAPAQAPVAEQTGSVGGSETVTTSGPEDPGIQQAPAVPAAESVPPRRRRKVVAASAAPEEAPAAVVVGGRSLVPGPRRSPARTLPLTRPTPRSLRPTALTGPMRPRPSPRRTAVRAGSAASVAAVVAVGARARGVRTRRALTPMTSRRPWRMTEPMRLHRANPPPMPPRRSPRAPCPDRAAGDVAPVPARRVATCVTR